MMTNIHNQYHCSDLLVIGVIGQQGVGKSDNNKRKCIFNTWYSMLY